MSDGFNPFHPLTSASCSVPIRQDKNLIQLLSRLDLDQEIPPGVYTAVAEILAFVIG